MLLSMLRKYTHAIARRLLEDKVISNPPNGTVHFEVGGAKGDRVISNPTVSLTLELEEQGRVRLISNPLILLTLELGS